MTNRFSALLVAGSLALAGGANAAYVLNEMVSDTPSSPNHQFVELYTDTPGESTTGLSLIVIRTFGGALNDTPTLDARIDLSGAPVGQFFLVANEAFSTTAGRPTPNQVVLDADPFLRTGPYEVLLVPTSSVDPGWVVGTYAFTGTEFNDGADVINAVFFPDEPGLEANAVFASGDGIIPDDGGFISVGAYRDPAARADGTGGWLAHLFPGGPVGTLPAAATPGGPNSGASSVDDWNRYE